MRNYGKYFLLLLAVIIILVACSPAAVPTEETTPETQGEELVSTLSMLPKQAISIHRAETPAEEDTETDRTDIVFVPYYASVEQLTSNSWVDQTHVTKSTVLNLTKTDAVEVKWEAPCGRPLGHVAGGAADGLLLSAQPRGGRGAAPDGRGLQRARGDLRQCGLLCGAEAAFDRHLPSGQRHPA